MCWLRQAAGFAGVGRRRKTGRNAASNVTLPHVGMFMLVRMYACMHACTFFLYFSSERAMRAFISNLYLRVSFPFRRPRQEEKSIPEEHFAVARHIAYFDNK
jgi:hypothetical protein